MYVDFMYILGVYSLVLGNSCNMIFRQILCLNLSMGYWRLWVKVKRIHYSLVES